MHLLYKGLIEQRIRKKMASFLVRGLSKRPDQFKTVIDHLLLFIRIIIFPFQPLQILKHTPRDVRSQVHTNDPSPVHHRTILISLQPAPPSLVDDPIKQVVSMQVLKQPIIVDNLLPVLENRQGVEIHVQFRMIFFDFLKPVAIGADGLVYDR